MSFTDADAAKAWSAGADAYDTFVESGADYYRTEVHGPALLAACEPLRDCAVLDLGCGQGYFSRQLASRGANVDAVDISPELLAHAKRHDVRHPLGIRYHYLSAAEVATTWQPGHFDLVTACMSIQDMADVPRTLHASAAVLRAGGRMVFSVPHPVTDPMFRVWERDAAGRKVALKLDQYFDIGPGVCGWNMPRLTAHWSSPCWRYTLSKWTQLVGEAGFVIHHLHEPRPTAEQVAASPRLDDCRRMPYFLRFVEIVDSAFCLFWPSAFRPSAFAFHTVVVVPSAP
jgi:2-polyprenyl-3-methyl-5-hydroxy-6-metoxy-1,4-benzoquinol methylase